jgi:hypothetical protein
MDHNKQAKKVAVLYVSSDTGKFLVIRHTEGLWGPITGACYGVRDDTIHFVTTQASRVGLTCSVNRIGQHGTCHGHILVSAVVSCSRFWERDGVQMMSGEEVSRLRGASQLLTDAIALFSAQTTRQAA